MTDAASAHFSYSIDLDTNEILSYGDSSFAKHNKSVHETVSSWKDNVQRWAGQAVGQQVVLGGNDGVKDYSSPPLIARNMASNELPDPRAGLLTFLAVQSPSTELTNVLLAAPRRTIIDRMTLETNLNGPANSFTINGVPSALEPVKTELTYVHNGDKLQLAWKYVLKTEDNMYEAYVAADKSVASGDEETLLVIDWVRDFRPTGGEMGVEALSLAPTFSSARSTKGMRGGRKSGMSTLLPSVDEGIEVSLSSANVTPTYKVFPWGM